MGLALPTMCVDLGIHMARTKTEENLRYAHLLIADIKFGKPKIFVQTQKSFEEAEEVVINEHNIDLTSLKGFSWFKVKAKDKMGNSFMFYSRNFAPHNPN